MPPTLEEVSDAAERASLSKGSKKPPNGDAPAGMLAHLSSDLPASLVVFLVALPLSLGIALASGAPLMSGLIAAIIGGIVIGFVGGAPMQVSGPAAGLTVIVFGFIQQFGWGVTCAITVAAGLLQIAMGALGVAPIALGMAPAVIHAMLAAIGILIALSQMHVLLGHEPAGKGLKNLFTLPEHILQFDPATVTVGVITIALLVLWRHIPWARLRALPAALGAVVVATLVSLIFPMDLPRVQLGGDLFSSLRLPELPAGDWIAFVGAVLTLGFVASAESLLCAVATDKLHSGPRANLHKELVGQGIGNSLSGLLGGLPVTGVIVRSTANITAGARTRLSAILHGVWVLLFVVLLPGVIMQVPLAALAGLLIYTGIKLVRLDHIKDLAHHGELIVYVITLAAIVATNLLLGLGIGFGVAILRLLWKMTHVDVHVDHEGDNWTVYVDGSLTFAGVPRLMAVLCELPPGKNVRIDLELRFIDHAGLEALKSWRETYKELGGEVHLDHLTEVWVRSQRRESRRRRQGRRDARAAAAEASAQ